MWVQDRSRARFSTRRCKEAQRSEPVLMTAKVAPSQPSAVAQGRGYLWLGEHYADPTVTTLDRRRDATLLAGKRFELRVPVCLGAQNTKVNSQ
jgi:hypothetical protein